MLTVIPSDILRAQRLSQVHFAESLEPIPLLAVPRALGFVELEQHDYIVDTNKWRPGGQVGEPASLDPMRCGCFCELTSGRSSNGAVAIHKEQAPCRVPGVAWVG